VILVIGLMAIIKGIVTIAIVGVVIETTKITKVTHPTPQTYPRHPPRAALQVMSFVMQLVDSLTLFVPLLLLLISFV